MSNKQNRQDPSRRTASTACRTNGERKSAWQEIGAVWPHKDGKGFNLQFAARPLEGAAIVLRAVIAEEEAA